MRLKSLLLAAVMALGLAVPAVANPEFWAREWPNTDFDKTSVDSWTEILSGGPPKDGIPALNEPQFIRAGQETRIDDREPVITVEIGTGQRRAPIRSAT